MCRICRVRSYNTIDAATPTFSDDADPPIGTLTIASQSSRQARLMPVVSFPQTRIVGRVRSHASTITLPCSSDPIT